jgi:hypothetical protein
MNSTVVNEGIDPRRLLQDRGQGCRRARLAVGGMKFKTPCALVGLAYETRAQIELVSGGATVAIDTRRARVEKYHAALANTCADIQLAGSRIKPVAKSRGESHRSQYHSV